MKKVNKFFLLGGLLSVAAITSSCSNSSSNPAESGSGSTVEKETIKIQFVPSNAPDKLATLAKKMAPLLEKIEPNYKFSITTGTDYAATTTALLADQIDIGFLTASGYAEATLKNPGKVEVLVTSVRDGYQVQKDYKTEAEQIKAMNGEVEGYEYLGQQSTEQVNWYTSQLVVRKDAYVDVNKDGKIDILDMAGKTVGRMGNTSGAGYLRPLKYLADHGMSMVDNITDPKTQIKGIDFGKSGYSAA
ncbi:MAG: PhnD/SsuA/transferrin family substrate-binding protein, partial [Mollicutes bacterium]|nr:PhnD/SsuA/transferrin family substrate-binding protein [Mollicutes bacterium]